jgi:O-antigen ligase
MTPPFHSAEEGAEGGVLRARQPASFDLAAAWSRIGPAIGSWLLPFALVVYLALKGGGYDEVIRGEVGIAIWWIVLLGALVGILPVARISRAGWVGLGLIAAFWAWMALGITWSDNAERSVAEVARIATYAGVFALALSVQGRDGLRRTVGALGAAVSVVAALALLSRLHPSWFPHNDLPQYIPDARSRLNYPLNYWNGLAAFMAMGIPLVLATANRARHLPLQALAAAAVPVMAVTAYYTLSRGGVIEVATGLIVLLALHPRRLTLLPTMLVAGAGSAIVIAAAAQRDALENGLNSSAAHSQGNEMFAIVLVVVAGVALLQVAIGLATRDRYRLRVSRRVALPALAVTAVAAIAIALAAGFPGYVSDQWQEFKAPGSPGNSSPDRFASSSGNGRYQLWQAAVDANQTDPVKGIGPGTYEYFWAQHGKLPGFVVNAHSLYLESLGELGIVGLILIVSFLTWVLATGAIRAFSASRDRTVYAGATAAAAAFAVAAGVDWVWQIAVIPVALLLLAGAILRSRRRSSEVAITERPLAARLIMAGVALIGLVAIAIPLASTEAVRASQEQFRSQNLTGALDEARTADNLQPYSATASLQEALVLEAQGNFDEALAAAKSAASEGSADWRNWLVLSRIQAELGNVDPSIAAYKKAKSLNPRSPLFTQ